MAVSRRLRFEVLRRDGHTCRYCGGVAPEVSLTVDHVTPIALGGTDEPENLVACCVDCNSGKSSSSPDAAHVADVAETQTKWEKAHAEVRGRHEDARWACDEFYAAWGEWKVDGYAVDLPHDWRFSVKAFVNRGLTVPDLVELVDVVMAKPHVDRGGKWRYFCGCCWRRIEDFNREVEAEMHGRAEVVQVPKQRESFCPECSEPRRLTSVGLCDDCSLIFYEGA